MGREGRAEMAQRAGASCGRAIPVSMLVVVLLVLFLISWIPSFIYDRYWTKTFLSLTPLPIHILSKADPNVYPTNTHTKNYHQHDTNINIHVRTTQFHNANAHSHTTNNLSKITSTYFNATNTQLLPTNIKSLITNTYINVTSTHTHPPDMYFNTSTNSNATNAPPATRSHQTNTPFQADATNSINTYTFLNITNTHSHKRNTSNISIHAYSNTATTMYAPKGSTSTAGKGSNILCEEAYQEEGPRKKVVLWTPFWHTWEGWKGMMQHHGALREGRCPVWRCEFLWGVEMTADQVRQADAIIFFSVDVLSRPLPPRFPHTFWIWLELEAPPISQYATLPWSKLEQKGVVFNLTMSYHHFSSITALPGQLLPLSIPQHCPLPSVFYLNTSSQTYTSYRHHMHKFDVWLHKNGRVVDIKLLTKRKRQHGGLIYQPGDNITLTEPLPDEYGKKNVQGDKTFSIEDSESILTPEEIKLATRPRLAVWMASHCPTYSQREALVAALQRFVAITTVGKCGELRCGKNHLDTYCYRWLAASHLFYLSFENALCDDYHTEKLWIPLEHGMVPVVYSAPTLRHILPFDSYIDVSNFSSAAALATHLVYLATHPSAYLRHLQWRRYWWVHWPVSYCSLCAVIHNQTHPTHTTLDHWWNNTATCYAPFTW